MIMLGLPAHRMICLNQIPGVAMCIAGDCAAYVSVDLHSECLDWLGGQWQPCTQATPDSRWLIVGRHALDSKTMAITMLASQEQMDSREVVERVAWCGDGLHAIMLVTLDLDRKVQQMRVWHVTSGTLTASLGCCCVPVVFRKVDREELYSMGMYVSCEMQSVLIPESQTAASLCKLPGLERIAQFDGPVVDGEAATLLSLGWADHGCLIVMLWQVWQTDDAVVVMVHSGSDGSLCHTLRLKPHDPDGPDPALKDHAVDAFSVCPDQPAAAIAWAHDVDALCHLAVIDLTTGTQRLLQRFSPQLAEGICYCRGDIGDVEFAWSPSGQHLMVQGGVDVGDDLQNWAIFTSPSGRFCEFPQQYPHKEIPVWSSSPTLCLIGDGRRPINAVDLSTDPIRPLPSFGSPTMQPASQCAILHPQRCVFCPGTRDVIYLESIGGPKHPITHWKFNASTSSSTSQIVPGFSIELKAAFAARHVAWQPSIKSAAIYALAERRKDAAVHLIDAKKHRRLFTWTSDKLIGILHDSYNLPKDAESKDAKKAVKTIKEMAGQMQASFAHYPASLAWSSDGKRLAVTTLICTVILSFAPDQAVLQPGPVIKGTQL